jgi:hypothetical protein
MIWAEEVTFMVETEYIKSLRGTEGKGLLGRPRCRREYSTKVHLKQIGLDSLDWINLPE